MHAQTPDGRAKSFVSFFNRFYSLSMLINMNIDTKYVPSPDYVTCILAYLAV